MEEKERLKKHLEYLCSFDKLTGEPEALQAVAYISDVLKKYGVSCHTETFPAYLSNPVKSSFDRRWKRNSQSSQIFF